jgi:hypothetical protein
VLTVKTVPHRPGTAPALGLRAGRDVFPFYRKPQPKGNDMNRSIICTRRSAAFTLSRPMIALLLASLALLTAQKASGQSQANQRREFTVMTRNLYVGADLTPLILNPTPQTVEATFAKVEQTNFPARAEAIADVIGKTLPTIIGLQEVALYRSQTPGDFLLGQFVPNAEHVEYDFLQILLNALAARGLAYEAVAVLPIFDAELPGIGRDIRLTEHEVILARSDLSPDKLLILAVGQGYFTNRVELMFPFVGKVPIARGWVGLDLLVCGKPLRFLSTHLEPAESDAEVQLLQAGELLAGPADTDVPLVIVGDFNSSADPHPLHGTPTYDLLTGAGCVDAWRVARPGETGYTVRQAELLDNEESLADARIDLILLRDGMETGRVQRPDLDVLAAEVVGDQPAAITDAVRWASDHFGVVAGLRLQP